MRLHYKEPLFSTRVPRAHYACRYVHLPILVTSSKPAFCQFRLLHTPPNVAKFGVPLDVATSVLHQMCQNLGTHRYYQMWLLLYSTKCGNIWSTHGYYQMCVATSVLHQMWHLEYPWILPNVATSVLHQMWQHLEYPWILINVATSVLHQMWQHLEYPWILPNCRVPVWGKLAEFGSF